MEKERKVYEAPELRVHQIMSAIKPLCGSSGNDGTGEAEEGSRRLWLDDEEE